MQGISYFRIVMLVIVTILAFSVDNSDNIELDKRTSAYVNGDFIIGALFPLHHQPSTKTRYVASLGIKCGEIREQYGIQRVEVTLQTLDKINNDPHLLPNLTLGVEIRDECWYAPVALQQSIELIRDAITPISNIKFCLNEGQQELFGNGEKKGPLVGVVGPGASSVALQVQNLLQLFHIPQVGYSTTSRDLSDKSRFHYFLRVVPSDYYQAQVMLDIVRYFGWTYVSAVNTDENYGQSGIQAFRELAEEADVCIAREDSVLSNAADEIFDKVVLNLKQDPNAVVVVCFCEGFTIRGLLGATKRLNMTNHFLFIGSDGWADRDDVTRDYEAQAWGSLSIRIHSPYVESFDTYYWSLRPESNTRNPWFKEFWQAKFACTLKTDDWDYVTENSVQKNSGYLSSTVKSLDYTDKIFTEYFNQTDRSLEEKMANFCSDGRTLAENYKQDPKLSFVIKAIYSFAHALHDMHVDICGKGFFGVCEKMLPFNGSLFKNYLMNISFEYNGETFEFDENGDPPGRYDIMNYQKQKDGSFDYVQVGSWNNRSLLWIENIQLPKIRGKHVVQSVCSEECKKGHYKNVQQGGKDKRCCWVCVPCSAGEILVNSGESCKKCPKGYVPNGDKTVCQLLPIKYVQWHERQAIIAMIFSALGFLSTSFTLIVFLKYNNTPVVKSSTKELCYIILAGMTLAHASIFVMLTKPDFFSCAMTRFLPGIGFAMIYSALLTKTNRIARILAGNKRRFPKRRPMFMSALAQVVITLFLISIEVFVAGSMLHYQAPDITYVYLPDRTLLECKISLEGIIVPLSFDFVLILLCTVYAVKTRNVPENFNEAKFIGFAMYTTCVIWIAFVPIYYGSGAKVITMCMCVTLSAMVTWIFLFIPKLYIILLQPEKNNRAMFTTAKIRCHIGSRVASATSEKTSLNSWRESSISITNPSIEKYPKEVSKRTLSCQTGNDLLEILLNPQKLVDDLSATQTSSFSVKITERDCCCAEDNCQMKNIIITLPDDNSYPIK